MTASTATPAITDPAGVPKNGRRQAAMIGGALGLFALGALATALVLEAPRTRDATESTPVAAVTAPAATTAVPPIATAAPNDGAPPAAVPAPVPVTKPAPVAKTAPKKATQGAQGGVVASEGTSHGSTTPIETQPAVVQACATCGVIEAVTPVTQKGEGTGLGAVAGGVLGGVLGHQVGGGTGKKALTVLGAVGGGLAGHEVEKRARSTTVYQMKIRMADGSTRTVTQAHQLSVGQRVHVDGQSITPDTSTDTAPTGGRAVDTSARSS